MYWHFFIFRINISSARMTPVRKKIANASLFKVRLLFSLFLCPKSPCAFGIYFKKGGNTNEKTKLPAFAQADAKTSCLQAANVEKGGAKACKVSIESCSCIFCKATTSPESRCMIWLQ